MKTNINLQSEEHENEINQLYDFMEKLKIDMQEIFDKNNLRIEIPSIIIMTQLIYINTNFYILFFLSLNERNLLI